MNPELVDGLTNALVWAWTQTLIYGPGLAVAVLCVAVSWARSKVRGWRERRRTIRHLEHFANHSANRSTRKEKP